MFNLIKSLFFKKLHLYHVYAVAECNEVDKSGRIIVKSMNLSYFIKLNRQLIIIEDVFNFIHDDVRKRYSGSLNKESISIKSVSYLGRVFLK